MTTLRRTAATALAAALLTGACAESDPDPEVLHVPGSEASAPEPRSSTVEVQPTEGSEVRGTVTFTDMGDSVRVTADLTGLAPGEHGFHIHETGDCSAPDASSAGGHYAPEGSAHGGPDQQPPRAHVGDLGNLQAGEDGRARYEDTFRDLAFEGDHGILGRAIIVHEGVDDLASQPSGDAGDRMACGVIAEGS